MILVSAKGLGRQYSGDPIFNDLDFARFARVNASGWWEPMARARPR